MSGKDQIRSACMLAGICNLKYAKTTGSYIPICHRIICVEVKK